MKRILLASLSFLFLIFILSPAAAKAQTGCSIENKSITLYTGNRAALKFDSGYTDSEIEDYIWRYWDYPFYFTSSDRSVVDVDYDGNLLAMGSGTATVTLHSAGKGSATCKVTVKKNDASISKKSLKIYSGSSATVKVSWKGKKISGYDYMVFDSNYNSSYGLSVYSEGNGSFTVSANTPGTYYLYLGMNIGEKHYSKVCTVEAVKSGPASDQIVVAVGKTKHIDLENATFVSASVANYSYYYDSEPSDANEYLSLDSSGNVTGLKTGSSSVLLTYINSAGSQISSYITVYITDPEYVPFSNDLLANHSYTATFNNTSYYSDFSVSGKDSDIIEVSAQYGSVQLKAKKAGSTTITYNVDGKKFTQKIYVIDPKLNFDNCFLQKGKSKTVKVTGLRDNPKVTFKSSDKKIATVSKTGKITAKKNGSCYITITAGNYTTVCSVNVTSATLTNIVTAGEKVLGSLYDQNKRMSTGYYDCSSFVWRSYNAAGIALAGAKSYAPSSYDMGKTLYSEGKEIASAYSETVDLLPGDLIFYDYGNETGRFRGIDHVAMYYGTIYSVDSWNPDYVYASRVIIHATPSEGVHFSDFDYYIPYCIVEIARPLK